DQHIDAVLVGPGHPLYAVVDESLNFKLAEMSGQAAFFIDPLAVMPYCVHFFEMSIRGQDRHGKQITLYAELVAVKEENGGFEVVPADSFINLIAHPSPPASVGTIDVLAAIDFLKSDYQISKRAQQQAERQRCVNLCGD